MYLKISFKNIVGTFGKQEYPKSGVILFLIFFLNFLCPSLERKRGVIQSMVEVRLGRAVLRFSISVLVFRGRYVNER